MEMWVWQDVYFNEEQSVTALLPAFLRPRCGSLVFKMTHVGSLLQQERCLSMWDVRADTLSFAVPKRNNCNSCFRRKSLRLCPMLGDHWKSRESHLLICRTRRQIGLVAYRVGCFMLRVTAVAKEVGKQSSELQMTVTWWRVVWDWASQKNTVKRP